MLAACTVIPIAQPQNDGHVPWACARGKAVALCWRSRGVNINEEAWFHIGCFSKSHKLIMLDFWVDMVRVI